MSRMLLLATVALLAVGLVVVAAGSAGDTPDTRTDAAQPGEVAEGGTPETPTDGPFALAAQRPQSPTQREVVEPQDRPRTLAAMREAERDHSYRTYFLDDLARRLGVTNIEVRRGIRETLASLRADARPIDPRTATADELAVLKRRMAARLGEQLDAPASRIVEAVRAEMVDTLRWAVSDGRITMEARARAVDCFDDPAACDVQKLRASLHSRGR